MLRESSGICARCIVVTPKLLLELEAKAIEAGGVREEGFKERDREKQ